MFDFSEDKLTDEQIEKLKRKKKYLLTGK
ncbi:hypothetical protein F856_gp04 [Enterobacteria phage vB_EcoS_Rogue1]|uniref:Uncharacterized protein n=1 Tax=Enterobacteria phage vB_EcoS_Rogue1 TaxID=1147155 RepID=K7PK28_9CAUD|nr:hypothetical protein F856_gp04 [Enterobacteria phage vB_EcoS_Rogue1]AFM76556.1 hypothetical protein Rogue1_004 [Enterobacteria phage vB_EcoS_Rogue1]